MKQQIHAYRGHGDVLPLKVITSSSARRHPRDRVFRPDSATDRRRRHPELRGRETLAMLEELGGQAGSRKRRERISTRPTTSFALSNIRLQMVADEQTHTLPEDREALEQFRASSAIAAATLSRRRWLEHLQIVQQHYAALVRDPHRQHRGGARAQHLRRWRARRQCAVFRGRGFARAPEAADLRAELVFRQLSFAEKRDRAWGARRYPAALHRSCSPVRKPGRGADDARPLPGGPACRLIAVASSFGGTRIW